MNLAGFNKHAQHLIRVAESLDWQVTHSSSRSGGVDLISPLDNTMKLHVPKVRDYSMNQARPLLRKVIRYGNPLKIDRVTADLGDGNLVHGKDVVPSLELAEGPSFGEQSEFSKAADGPAIELVETEEEALVGHTDEGMDEIKESIEKFEEKIKRNPKDVVGGVMLGGLKKHTKRLEDAAARREQFAAIEAELTKREEEPTIVSERPWLAHRRTTENESVKYESGTTIERKWSDGTTDYRCAKPGCGYTHALPRSVAMHYGNSKDHPKAEDGQEYRDNPYVPTATRTPANRIARLAAEILGALHGTDRSTYSDELLAKELATKIISKRDANAPEHEDPTPLTPELIIERIRRMVDNGSYVKSLAEQETLREQMKEQEERLIGLVRSAEENCLAVMASQEETMRELSQAKARATRAESALRTFQQLLNEEVGSEAESIS